MDERRIATMSRITLVVQNMMMVTEFYRDVLQLKPIFDLQVQPPPMDRVQHRVVQARAAGRLKGRRRALHLQQDRLLRRRRRGGPQGAAGAGRPHGRGRGRWTLQVLRRPGPGRQQVPDIEQASLEEERGKKNASAAIASVTRLFLRNSCYFLCEAQEWSDE